MAKETNIWATPIPKYLEELDSLERKELLQKRGLILVLIILSCIIFFFTILNRNTSEGNFNLPAHKTKITNESPKVSPIKAVTVDNDLGDSMQKVVFETKPDVENLKKPTKANQPKPLPKKKPSPQKKVTFELTP